MTRSLYFIGALAALALVFVAQSVVPVPSPHADAAAQAEVALAGAPTAADATSIAIDNLAAWPAAAGRRADGADPGQR